MIGRLSWRLWNLKRGNLDTCALELLREGSESDWTWFKFPQHELSATDWFEAAPSEGPAIIFQCNHSHRLFQRYECWPCLQQQISSFMSCEILSSTTSQGTCLALFGLCCVIETDMFCSCVEKSQWSHLLGTATACPPCQIALPETWDLWTI